MTMSYFKEPQVGQFCGFAKIFSSHSLRSPNCFVSLLGFHIFTPFCSQLLSKYNIRSSCFSIFITTHMPNLRSQSCLKSCRPYRIHALHHVSTFDTRYILASIDRQYSISHRTSAWRFLELPNVRPTRQRNFRAHEASMVDGGVFLGVQKPTDPEDGIQSGLEPTMQGTFK